MWSDLVFRIRAIFRRKAVETELDEEIRFHIEQQIEAYKRTGLTHEAAVRRSRLNFGGLDEVKEECRWVRGISLLETTLQDLRYALRGMRRSPVFTVTALVTLALTTATISTVFNLANTFFFRLLPADRPEQLVAVTPTRRHGTELGWVSYPDYVRFRNRTRTLQRLAAHYSSAPLFVSVNNNAREINGAVVSANFFPLLGLKPVLGRFFRPDEDSVPDRDRVAVFAYDLWRNSFDSSPGVLGAAVKINGSSFTVIGVAPASFRGMLEMPDEIYIPTMMLHVGYEYCDALRDENCTILSMVGRLAPRRSLEEAKAEMSTLIPPRWANAPEGDNTGVTVSPERGADNHNHELYARLTRLLLLVSAVLLLVCCANLAGLLTARSAAREREFAIRASLGAARLRLIRQLITESLLLAVVGGILGILVSLALTGAVSSMFYSMDEEGHPIYYNFTVQPAVLAAVLAVSIAAGFFFGLIPAFRSSRGGPAESLKGHASTLAARSQLSGWLVGTQASVAVALLAVAGLLLASTRMLMRGISFEPSHVALMRLRPGLLRYPPKRAQQFVHAVIRQLESLPGVESASMIGTGAVLLGGDADVALPEWPDKKGQAVVANYADVGPRYSATLRTPILRGREFDDRDTVDSPRVAIVNRTLAHRLWPHGNALGEIVLVRGQACRVVGLAEDVHLETRTYKPQPQVYVPYWQNPAAVDARLCVRVHGDPAAMLSLLQREIHRVNPDVPVAETITLPLQLNGAFQTLRMSATFVSYTAALAVLLSVIGVFGTLAFRVSRRTKEIGIRMALGAKSSEIRAMIVREGMTVVLIAICAGLALAAIGERLVRHLLLGAASRDMFYYTAAASLVACTGLFACWIPASRAARVEPLIALRED